MAEPISTLLEAASRGDERAFGDLYTRVYGELRALAHRVRGGRGGETLSTTVLVHEAYLKLLPSSDVEWQSRGHFFGVAARAMRQVLVDAARRRLAEKRGGGEDIAVTLDEGRYASPVRSAELVALDDALARLADVDPRRARVVECRFFAGLAIPEVARLLGVSTGTVERDWRAARAWLATELAGGTE